jgi:hypothetical protein
MNVASMSTRGSVSLLLVVTGLLSVLTVDPAGAGAKHVSKPARCWVADTWTENGRWHASFRLGNEAEARWVIRGSWDVDGAPRYRDDALSLHAQVEGEDSVRLEEVFGRRQPTFTELRCGGNPVG